MHIVLSLLTSKIPQNVLRLFLRKSTAKKYLEKGEEEQV
jgi:hypothetical protein